MNNLAYKALYREWRPQTFNDVVGQLVVDNDTRYIGMLKSGTILLPSYSIAIVK